MAIQYITLDQGTVDEKFKREALSTGFVNQDFEFTGGNGIRLYSVGTTPLTDYDRETGYGTPSLASTSKQEHILSQEKKFHTLLDNMDIDETGGALNPAAWLARQIREQVVPTIDTYRFAQMAAATGVTTVTEASTKLNIYEHITDGTEVMDDEEVPAVGRIIGMTPKSHKLLKNSDDFVKNSESGQAIAFTGQVGLVDGLPVVSVPKARLGLNVNFIIAHPVATTSPIKLSTVRINDDPDNYDGYLVSGRFYYDAFVLDNKVKAIYVHKEV